MNWFCNEKEKTSGIILCDIDSIGIYALFEIMHSLRDKMVEMSDDRLSVGPLDYGLLKVLGLHLNAKYLSCFQDIQKILRHQLIVGPREGFDNHTVSLKAYDSPRLI